MGILDNFENAWDIDLETESSPIKETDAMGREIFWEDMGRPEGGWTKGIASYDASTVDLFLKAQE